MKKFRFALAGLLRVRGARRLAGEGELRLASARRHEAAAKMAAIDLGIEEVRGEALRGMARGEAFAAARRAFAVEMILQARREDAALELAAALRAESAAQAALVEARRDERLLERLRETKSKAHAATAAREEQRIMDDRRPVVPAARRKE
ncbi:MAG TPA: hypothetical protein VE404_09585 [Verrucomicrobiae bacterium]|nr:hypothetical protein [Verrucomicrobiae bacterium]